MVDIPLETETVTAKLTWQLNNDMELVSISALDSIDRYFNADEDGSAVGVLAAYTSTTIPTQWTLSNFHKSFIYLVAMTGQELAGWFVLFR